jgi:hypothetical protein
MTILLQDPPEIRFLELSAPDEGGTLTDRSLECIAGKCPKLQVLSITGQEGMTIAGLQSILRACPLLELYADAQFVQSLHFVDLVGSSTTLLLLYLGLPYELSNPT